MIMSQSTTVDLRGEAGSGILTMPVAAMKRMCAAYIAWRMEKSAIAALRSMSDRALTDIGLRAFAGYSERRVQCCGAALRRYVLSMRPRRRR
jgi:histone H3/H4